MISGNSIQQRPSSEANSCSANQFPVHYGIWFITIFPRVYTLLPILKHTNLLQILTPYFFKIYIHIHITFPTMPRFFQCFHLSDFLVKFPYALLTSPVCMWPTHLIFLHLITLTVFGQDYKL
jgi:hypothetical protein